MKECKCQYETLTHPVSNGGMVHGGTRNLPGEVNDRITVTETTTTTIDKTQRHGGSRLRHHPSIRCERYLTGTPPSVWGETGAGSPDV